MAPVSFVSDPPLAPQDEVNFYLGPLMLGWAIQCGLFGAFVVKYVAYRESPHYREDSLTLRWLLAITFFLNAWHSAVALGLIIHRSVSQRRYAGGLEYWIWLDCVTPLAPALIGPVVQGYFSQRACMLLGHFGFPRAKRILAAILGASIMASSGGSIALATQGFLQLNGAELHTTIPTTFYLVSAAFVDILMSCSLTWVLSKHTRGFSEQTDTILKKLTYLGWQTAGFTALVAIIGAVLALVFQEGIYSTCKMCTLNFLPGMYCFSMLTNAAARQTIIDSSHPSSSGGGSRAVSSRSSEGTNKGSRAVETIRPLPSRFDHLEERECVSCLKRRAAGPVTVTLTHEEEVELDSLPPAITRSKSYSRPEFNGTPTGFGQPSPWMPTGREKGFMS